MIFNIFSIIYFKIPLKSTGVISFYFFFFLFLLFFLFFQISVSLDHRKNKSQVTPHQLPLPIQSVITAVNKHATVSVIPLHNFHRIKQQLRTLRIDVAFKLSSLYYYSQLYSIVHYFHILVPLYFKFEFTDQKLGFSAQGLVFER